MKGLKSQVLLPPTFHDMHYAILQIIYLFIYCHY